MDMSATETREMNFPQDLLTAAAPVAECILEFMDGQPIGVALLAVLLAQLEIAEDHKLDKTILHGLYDHLWETRQIYNKMRNEAH
jgi:hypothetical protein